MKEHCILREGWRLNITFSILIHQILYLLSLSLTSLTLSKPNTLFQVFGVDTGAGEVSFDQPVTVGFVVEDREGVVCDDTCEYAFDGMCDDGTESEYDSYYESYGYYQDDDLGGYFGGQDGTEGEMESAGGSYADVRTIT